MIEPNKDRGQDAFEIDEDALDSVVGGMISGSTGGGSTPTTKPTVGGGGNGTNTPVGGSGGGIEPAKPGR